VSIPPIIGNALSSPRRRRQRWPSGRRPGRREPDDIGRCRCIGATQQRLQELGLHPHLARYW